MGQKGEELADLESMADKCIAFSDDGHGVQSDDMMREAMLKAKSLGKMIVAHCEVNDLLKGGYIHDGKYAAEHGYSSFCTTLLVSPYQQHDKIASVSEQKAEKYGASFEYMDFRPGFRQGQDMAREIGLYRQKYCGCIFSLESSKFRDKIYRSFEK
jgi:hypothetical protein